MTTRDAAATTLTGVTGDELVAALPEGIAVVDLDGRVRYASDRAAKILGYASGADLVGRAGTEVVAPASHDQLRARLSTYRDATQPAAPTAYLARRSDGGEAWVEVTSTPLRDASGATTGFVAALRDITDRVHAAEAQRVRERAEAAEHQQRAILEHLPVGVAIVAGERQRLLYVNDELVRMLGCRREELRTAEDFRVLAHPDPEERAAYRRQWAERRAASPEGRFAPIPTVITTRHGARRFVHVHAARVGDEEVVTFVDLTERLRHEEELTRARDEAESANRAKSDFLATMSHELRTPLNAILGFSETLADGLLGELRPEQRHAVGRIEESGRHLLSLITDLLDLSKIEAGRMELDRTRVDVEAVCESSLRLVRDAAQKKRITLTLALRDAPSTLTTDERRLKQILVNLLGNAVKFTPADGHVGLDVDRPATGDGLRFTVWDTGIGIGPEDQARLWKPFVQVDSSLARRFEGTGLGLALVARLSALLGGVVGLESHVGKGSRFFVTLPIGP